MPEDPSTVGYRDALLPNAAEVDTGQPPTVAHPSGGPSTSPPRESPSLNHHELFEQLGVGGMGIVFRARDTVLDRQVALKMMRSGSLASPQEVERFYREARAAARLHHPNIVPIHGIGLHAGLHSFTMDYLPGGSLADHLGKYQADPRAAVALVEKVARAVQSAHEQGIVHRDLKPSNVLLDEHGEPMISDFGLAKMIGGATDVTLTGQVVGTPAYMAPEQASGQGSKVTARTDVWGLGVILYEMLVGKRPFLGASSVEMADKIRTTDPTPPRKIRRNLPRDLETIILTCLEKEPARRYASALELANDLRHWLNGEPIAAHPPGWFYRASRVVLRHPTLTVATVLVLTFTLLAWLAFRQPTPPPTLTDPIEFIGESGLLHPHRWAVGDGSHQVFEDQTLLVQAKPRTVSLFELLDHVPWERYRFTADVQHVDGQNGFIGLYVAHKSHETDQGDEHWFLTLSFAERALFPPRKEGRKERSEAKFQVHRYRPPGRDRGLYSSTNLVTSHEIYGPQAGQWRKLSLEVRREHIRVFWLPDKEPFGSCILAQVLKQKVSLLANDLVPLPRTPTLSPTTGGLGLFCNESAALFKNIRVEPLSETDD
jgi:hypothetical protein